LLTIVMIMFDLFYIFSEWLTTFLTSFPLSIDPITGDSAYLLALYTNSTIIIYLLWCILLVIFILLIFFLLKTVIYSLLSALH
jgi:hypothetical protein